MKKINTTKLLSLGLVSLCALTIGAPSVLAENPTANTKSDVKFIEDTSTIDPEKPEVVDPTDPEKEPGVVDPGGEGTGGNGTKAFNINWVSNFKFGEIKIAGKSMTAFAQPTTLNWATETGGTLTPTGDKTAGLANFLQVTDNTGSNAGWNVKVSGTPFYELNDAGQEITTSQLAGAQINLTEPQVVGLLDSASLAPTTSVTADKDILTGTNTVLQAAAGKGQGTWSLTWGAQADKTTLKGITVASDDTTTGAATSGVKLTVPVTAQPKANKSYRSNLVWVLSTAP